LLAQMQNDYPQAKTHYQEALTLSKAISEPRWEANMLNNLGRLALLQGDLTQASPLLEQSLAAFRGLNDRQGIAASLANLGQIALLQKQAIHATELFELALSEWKALGYQQQIVYTLLNLADIALEQQDMQRTRDLCTQALYLLNESKDRLGTSQAILKVVTILASMGTLEPAVKLMAAFDTLSKEIQNEVYAEDQEAFVSAMKTAQSELNKAAFQAAWQAGKSLSMEQAIRLAQQIIR
jgi:tetratricopeptide (TPR) repeat protein